MAGRSGTLTTWARASASARCAGNSGVTAFGVNAIVLPPGFVGDGHHHDEQEEVYFVHSGRMRMRFGDGGDQLLEAGCLARVDPATVRSVENAGEENLVFVCFGGKDGYVGRDAHYEGGTPTAIT